MPVNVLIIGSDRQEDGIGRRLAGRALLWGLEQCGIAWDVHLPGTGPVGDLTAYDAVFCWSYLVYRSGDYIRGALEIEARARSLGIPVINSVERCAAGHSFFLETWHDHGVPCGRCQRFEDLEAVRLAYPLLLRRDGVHKGRDLVLARTPEQARELIRERKAEGREDLDLAIEFVDVRDRHGLYNRYRSWVVGERIIPVSVLVSRHWLVNYGDFRHDQLAARYGRDFLRHGEPNAAELLAAARLTGSDVLSLDYARRRDGRYVFWEANRHFLTLEDYGKTPSGGFEAATGVDAEERRRAFEALGLALGDLVIERARR